MRSRILLIMLLLAGTSRLPGFAQVSVSVQGKDEKAVVPAQDYSQEAFVIERFSTRIVEEADGTGSRETTTQVKILADAGVKAFAVLNFTYTSANEVVDIDYVRVRKPDGTVVKTPDYNIQDMPGEVTRSAPLYSDIHEKHVAVKGLGAGDVLEYLVRFRVTKPEVPGHFWYEYSFWTEGIVKDERLEISVPADKYVRIVSPQFKPEIENQGGRRIYRWAHNNLIREEKDPRQAPRRIPPTPSVQMTTFASWEEVGRWYRELQKAPLEVTPAIQAKATELTKGLKTDDERFRAIYNFVALQFHYIGLDFGIGRYQPHAADDVLGNGYGDCKDKHTLLAALLKASGYDAWPALIHTNRKLDPDVPSPAQFNHVITVIPNGGKLIWLDSTPEVAPYQLLLTLLRDKEALVIPTDKTPSVMKTPAESFVPQRQGFAVDGSLSSDGTFTGHIEQTYRGDGEVVLRLMFRQVSQSQWKEATQGFSSRLGFGGEVSNVKISPPEQTDQPFHLSYDYVRKDYSDWDNKQFSPPLPPMGVEASKEQQKPLEPVLIGAAGEIVYRSKFVLPPGYSIMAPNGLDLVEPFAEYHALATLQDGALITSRRLVIKKSEVALDNWERLRDFGKAVSDDEWKFITLSGGNVGGSTTTANRAELDQKFRDATQAMKNADGSRAQELLQQIIASDPKYQMAHLNLGVVLMMKNKVSEGMAEFRKEQEISPNDVRAYQLPANFLTYMSLKDQAIPEWRKVLKVDPKNQEAAVTLGKLLSETGKGSEAAEVLENAVKASPDSQILQIALGETYLKGGDADKGISHMRQAMQAGVGGIDPGMLNDAAYMLAVNKTHIEVAKEYADKALAELEARSVANADSDDLSGPISAQFAAVWDTLGWVYFQMGDTARAENFIRPAWVLGQQSVVGDHLGQTYEKLGKKKQAASVYEQALSAKFMTPSFTVIAGENPAIAYQTNRNQILAHYKKMTGREAPPQIAIRRLPNGEWTKTPADELKEALEVKVSKTTSLSGIADFAVVLAPGKVERVRYIGGDAALKSMIGKLESASYKVEFPPGSGAKIVRRIQLSCNPSAGCTAEMLPPNQVRPGVY